MYHSPCIMTGCVRRDRKGSWRVKSTKKICQDRGLNTGPPECLTLQSVALPAELPRHTTTSFWPSLYSYSPDFCTCDDNVMVVNDEEQPLSVPQHHGYYCHVFTSGPMKDKELCQGLIMLSIRGQEPKEMYFILSSSHSLLQCPASCPCTLVRRNTTGTHDIGPHIHGMGGTSDAA